MHAAHALLVVGASSKTPFGIYTQLAADHLWAASVNSTPGGVRQFDPIRGALPLLSGSVASGLPAPVAVPGMNNRLGAVCAGGSAGLYANIGAIGNNLTILVVYNTLQPAVNPSYYSIIVSGAGPAYAAPGTIAFARSFSPAQIVCFDGVNFSPGDIYAIPGAASPYPALMLGTQDTVNFTRRINQLTKATVAHGDGAAHATANTLHTHGYSEPAGSGRCSGDHFMELAIFRRVLSDAEAITLMQDRAAYYGVTLAG